MDPDMNETTENTDTPGTDENVWKRLLFMILFAFLYGVSDIVLFTVAIVQFGFVAISGERNDYLLGFSASLTKFIYQIVQYLTFNSESKPFPFAAWPDAESENG